MGTWGAGNFDNDGARDYLDDFTQQLEDSIQACLASEGDSALDESGEAELVPNVAILTVLCQQLGARPPEEATVRTWKEQYLQIYDDQIDDLAPEADFKSERRNMIEDTFTKLEEQARIYWSR